MATLAARWSSHARGGYCRFGMSVESTSPSRPTAKQWVFGFEEGSAEMRGLLGGKGANLAEMTHILGSARVPGGFTITTEACVEYMKTDGRFPEGLDEEIAQAVTRLDGTPVSSSVAGAIHCSSRCARARLSRCPGCSTRSSILVLTLTPWRPWQRPAVTRVLPGTPFGDSSRCTRMWSGAFLLRASRMSWPRRARRPDRSWMLTSNLTLFRSSPSAFWPSSPSRRASNFQRTRGSSSGAPSRRCSVRGTTIVDRLPPLEGMRMSSVPRSPASESVRQPWLGLRLRGGLHRIDHWGPGTGG